MLAEHNHCGKQLLITVTVMWSRFYQNTINFHSIYRVFSATKRLQTVLWWWSREDSGVLQHTSAGCMTTDGDTLSGNRILDLSITGRSFCCLCIHRQGHPQLLVISVHWAESQSHKVMPRRTELLFSWIYITEPPPKPRGNGKMEFPARFNGRPWASWLEGTTKLWHTTAHFVRLLQDSMRLIGAQWAGMIYGHYNTTTAFILTSCNNSYLTKGETHRHTSMK